MLDDDTGQDIIKEPEQTHPGTAKLKFQSVTKSSIFISIRLSIYCGIPIGDTLKYPNGGKASES